MANSKTVYVANDNTEFLVESDADAHNVFLAAQYSIEAYITFAGLAKAQAGLMRRHIAGYIAFTARPDHDSLVAAAEQAANEKAAAEAAAEQVAKDKAAAETSAA